MLAERALPDHDRQRQLRERETLVRVAILTLTRELTLSANIALEPITENIYTVQADGVPGTIFMFTEGEAQLSPLPKDRHSSTSELAFSLCSRFEAISPWTRCASLLDPVLLEL